MASVPGQEQEPPAAVQAMEDDERAEEQEERSGEEHVVEEGGEEEEDDEEVEAARVSHPHSLHEGDDSSHSPLASHRAEEMHEGEEAMEEHGIITRPLTESEMFEMQCVRMCDVLKDESVWQMATKLFEKAAEQCALEGHQASWMACGVYHALSLAQPLGCPPEYRLSLAELLSAAELSPLEFFDKMNRWNEILNVPRRLAELSFRMERSLSVAAVVFKRFLPIFRSLFTQPDDGDHEERAAEQGEREAAPASSPLKLIRFIWQGYVLLKKQYAISPPPASEDLMSAFHLLLCFVEAVFRNLFAAKSPLVHAELLDEVDLDVLEAVCKQFNGVVLDAKHLRAHWFAENKRVVLKIGSQLNYAAKADQYLQDWEEEYQNRLRQRCELDEMIFLPASLEELFNEAYDGQSVDQLRRPSVSPESGGATSAVNSGSLFDATFHLRLSTQGLLNKLSSNTVSSINTLTVNTEQCSPHAAEGPGDYRTRKLQELIPTEWQLEGSALERILDECRDNPLANIKRALQMFSVKLEKTLADEEVIRPDFDSTAMAPVRSQLTQLASDLFYRLLERIASVERDKTKDYEFVSMFRKEEFLASLYACSLEIILHTYGSERVFPWSIDVFRLMPINFYKIIEVVVKAEPGLWREAVRHLNSMEEQVLEELAWTMESPLWTTLSRRADGVPSSESALNSDPNSRSIASQYSPLKRRRLEGDRLTPGGGGGGGRANTASTIFFRKVYFVAAARLCDLCERARFDVRGKQRVWTLFEHALRTETSLFAGRHLDQNLMCIVYVTAQISRMEVTFHDVMQHYRQQPQAAPRVYRRVIINGASITPEMLESLDEQTAAAAQDESNGGIYVDLITYYNKVFLPRMEEVVQRLESRETAFQLIQMPSALAQMGSPVCKILTDRVRVQALPSHLGAGSHSVSVSGVMRSLKYNLNRSPSKDLRMINQAVRRGVQPGVSPGGVGGHAYTTYRPISQVGYR